MHKRHTVIKNGLTAYYINITLIFILATLCRHNLHIMSFTYLKYTIQWLLAYSQSCKSITPMHFGTFSSLSKEISHPLAAIPHCPHL